ncbi:hypothetical protein GCM10007063_05490 [Lentibacillus kapialis]|uniref:O-antigen ligase-related domain-containing protein n=1 Tax=Lentibacillus kapialis TaxID=340214 RepID=A0A917PNK1_9BACI|nr:O-antigen ligase family protein [Lentibacillus kapialis]GGJ85925.1 hypothetical protein GCM10007063_05490 [Lentibacillus kapialis]
MIVLFQKLTYVLLWLTIFTMPIQKHFIIPGIGSLNKAVGIALAGLAVFTVLLQKEFKKLPLFFVLLILFIFVNIASYFWASVPADALDKSVLFLQLAFIAWAIYEFACTKERLDGLIKSFVLGCSVIAIQSIYQYLTGSIQMGVSTRFFIEGYNPNSLGIIWSLGLAMAMYLTVNGSKLYSLFIPAGAFAILLTGSRTAMVLLIFVAICSFWLLFKYRIRFRKIITLSLVIIGWFVVSQLPPGQLERFSTVSDELAGGTLNGRTVIWESGLETFSQRPVLGAGAGSYQEAAAVYGEEMSSHNSYLSILTENGLIGMGIFVIMLSILLAFSFKLEKRNPYRWLCLTLITTWMILSIASHAEAQKYTWIIFGIIITAHYINVKIKDPVKTKTKPLFKKRIVW